VHHQLKLTPAQQAAIAQIDERYEHRRNALRADVGAADAELAQALANEMALGTSAQRALGHIQGALGEMQRDSVVYVLDVRAVLTPEQQAALDRKIFETLALGPF
jgi:Spy/CpxP family protein refolding chaperone